MTKKITSRISHTYEVNKSKFLCVLCPYSQFAQTIEELKNDHPKGRHFVYAYRYLNEFDQIVENQSDDGEPKGSSGPPTLAVLRGEELLETAVIIVRYFGGIKLGVGGLIRAYGRSVHLGLEEARRNNFISAYIKQINSEYSIVIQNLGKLEHFLKNYESILIEKNFKGLEVEFIIGATRSEHGQINDFLMKIKY